MKNESKIVDLKKYGLKCSNILQHRFKRIEYGISESLISKMENVSYLSLMFKNTFKQLVFFF